jgi:hypothetical protein
MTEKANEVLPEQKKISPQLKYYKKMYHNNEEFRNRQKKMALDYYNSIREEQIKRYEEDEEYRKKRAVFRRNSYLKLKARNQAKKEEEEAMKALEEVHIAEKS